VVTSAAFGQAVPAQDHPAPIRVDVNVVNVLCTVYDKHGALVKDLGKDDFEVRENGRPQQIRYFARDTDLPLTVALLVDVSGSVRDFVVKEKGAALEFFDSVLRPRDHAVLLGFSSTIILWQDFTSSKERLRIALARLRPIPFRGLPLEGPMPSTLLYDAVHLVARDLNGVPGRKVMVIVSDGLDNGSRNHADTAIGALQAANTIAYGICYVGKFSGCSYLKELADPTGGRMLEAGQKIPLQKIFESIEEEMRSQYAIGYVPSNNARDGKFRKLEVRVRRKGLRVRTRKGYYAPSP
jgi:VWFA-related protein